MYNSAPAISLYLIEASKEEGKSGGGHILYTRELDARHISMKNRERQRGRQRQSETKQQTDKSSIHWQCCCLMSVSGDEAQSLQGQKNSARHLWGNSMRHLESWHQKKGSGMTQNKLDGPQSGKLCKTFKLTKRQARGQESRAVRRRRERERVIRQSLGGHANAQKAHLGKGGRGCGPDSQCPPHARKSKSVY